MRPITHYVVNNIFAIIPGLVRHLFKFRNEKGLE